MSTCKRLDLPTLGSQPIMPKYLRDHRFGMLLSLMCVGAFQEILRGWTDFPQHTTKATTPLYLHPTNDLSLDFNCTYNGQFTLWSMDHAICPWKMAFFNDLSSWSNFHGPTSFKVSFKSLGPLTMCKLNVDREEWPCTKK